jgi:aminoglycoside phosphotransferase family enzyme/predicted kinase
VLAEGSNEKKFFDSQEEIIAFLCDPRSYPDQPKRIRFLQTHASYVFLCSPYVFKVKKKVNFGFLDFSSLKNRRYYSEREVTLNRRLCPDIYLRVIPISFSAGKLAFGKGERVVEYAVKMRKLQDRYFMLRLLRHDKVTTKDLDRIVSRLKDFYEAETPTQKITAWGRIENLKISTGENFDQTKAFIGLTISREAFEAIAYYTALFYAQKSALFSARVQERRIRDCHGDLHLEHIHLAPETLSIFDCIEFNDRFRYIDVASDVAFLAMDLDHHDRPDLSRQITSRIADSLRDTGMLGLMDFYKCYRAYVRGKVESFQLARAEVPKTKQKRSRTQAERYFRLALRYALFGSEPTVLVIMGRAASGKSTLADALGSELGFEVISSDRTRKELAGVPLFQRVKGAARRDLYSEAMTNETYKKLFQYAKTQLDRHASLILDATFSRRDDRDELRRLLDSKSVNYRFIEAEAPDEVVKQRLEQRKGAIHVLSDARLEDFDMLMQSYQTPWEIDTHHRLHVATDRPITMTIAKTLKELVLASFEANSP